MYATISCRSMGRGADRAMPTQNNARQRPEMILVWRSKSFDWMAWANSDPVLAQQLEHYREYGTVDDVLILRRGNSS